jgi:N-acetylneuraminate lyase
MDKITGLIAAPFTGFLPDYSVNLNVIKEYAEVLYKLGLAGVFVNGTTGEGMSLTTEERKAVAVRWIESSPANFKVIIHVGSCSLQESKILAEHAHAIGAWGIGAHALCFFKPLGIEGLVDCCREIASCAPRLPFYYYHIPSMTNINLKIVDFLNKADGEIENLAGIKFTYEDLMDFRLSMELFGGKYDMLFGRDELLLCGLVLGAKGAVGSTYNYIPQLYFKMMNLYKEGKVDQAHMVQVLSMRIINLLLKNGGGIACGKALMMMYGLDLGPCRKPLTTCDDPVRSKIISEVKSLLRMNNQIIL